MKTTFLIAVASVLFCVAKVNSAAPEDLQHLKARANLIIVGQVLTQPKGKPRVYDQLTDFAFQLQTVKTLKNTKPVPHKFWVFFTSPNYHLKNRNLGGPWKLPVKVGARYIFFLQHRDIIGIRPYSLQLLQRL